MADDPYDLDVGSARLFLAVEELGSVSKAARRCGLSQPSATARLAKLERQLGVQLLERGPTGSLVTNAGHQLLPRCAGLVAAAAELAADARSMTTSDAPVLTIAATRHIAQHHLPGWIAAAGLENVELDLTESPTATVAGLVRDGDAALGFVAGPHAPLGLRSEEITSDEIMAVVAPNHRWVGRTRRITGVELASSRLIMRESGSGTRDVVQAGLAEHGLAVAGAAHEVASDLAGRLAAINGQGVAFAPKQSVASDLALGTLAALRLRGLELRQPIRVAWKGSRPSSAAARQFLRSITPHRS